MNRTSKRIRAKDPDTPEEGSTALGQSRPPGAAEVPVDTDGQGGAEPRVPIPEELSLLPLRDNVMFPAVVAPLTVAREGSVKLIDDAAVGNTRVIGVVTMK